MPRNDGRLNWRRGGRDPPNEILEMRTDRWGLMTPYDRALILLGIPHLGAILGDPGSGMEWLQEWETLPSIRVAKRAAQFAGRWSRGPPFSPDRRGPPIWINDAFFPIPSRI